MFVELENVRKEFRRREARNQSTAVRAVDDISLGVEAGRMLALVGPSGSGKTTLLRCLAGLESPDSGEIRIAGVTVYSAAKGIHVPTERRNLGLIFQSYALWPNMTVRQNVEYPLARRRVDGGARRERVDRHLDLVGCGHLADRYPHELSGGQQQRVALARALVYEPSLVLFDEPLSNLDAALRERLRYQVRELQRVVGFTGVYVTHDQSEAFFVGDEVAILSEGELVQRGRPAQIYKCPATAAVAAFVGAGNSVAARLAGENTAVSEELGRLTVQPETAGAKLHTGDEVLVMVRPEAVRLRPADGAKAATVLDAVDVGGHREYVVELPGGARWRVRGQLDDVAPGSRVSVQVEPGGAFAYPAASRPLALEETE